MLYTFSSRIYGIEVICVVHEPYLGIFLIPRLRSTGRVLQYIGMGTVEKGRIGGEGCVGRYDQGTYLDRIISPITQYTGGIIYPINFAHRRWSVHHPGR